jgi:MiaB/RimO family radical SAM methylthiotransferase
MDGDEIRHEEALRPGKPTDEQASVFVFTNGCHECRNDAARVEDFFRANGWDIATGLGDASLIVFQGCGVVEQKAEETLNTAEWLRQQYPAKEILVWGCISKTDPDGLRKVYSGPTFGPRQMARFNRYAETVRIEETRSNRLIDHVHARVQSGRRPSLRPYTPWGTPWVSEPCRPWSIRAATGCRGACSYCPIRESRGPLCSKPIDEIIAELHAGLEQGYNRFILLGTDLGCYGMDRDSNLAALLQAIAAIEGDFRLWLRHLNPCHMLTYLDELTSPLLSRIDVLELSPESGSDAVLAAMNRKYTASDFLHLVSRIRALKPKVAIKSQFIVGFPGETEQDFKHTVDLIRQSSIDFPVVFRYSPRPGQMSTRMPNPVPENVVTRRVRRLKLVAARRVVGYGVRCLLNRRHRLWRID